MYKFNKTKQPQQLEKFYYEELGSKVINHS